MNPKPACTALCCAGLIFGVSDATLLGQHLGRYVAMNGAAVSDLMEAMAPPQGATGDESAKPRSNMKTAHAGVCVCVCVCVCVHTHAHVHVERHAWGRLGTILVLSSSRFHNFQSFHYYY